MKHLVSLALLALSTVACSRAVSPGGATEPIPMNDAQSDPVTDTDPPAQLETATLGAGCFWCVEAVLEQLDGVVDVRSGYMGGHVENPTYKQVCTGTTGHAEVTQVDFDPSVITYGQVLSWFWRLHDPTTLNRQGNDEGPQYRSVIFTHSPKQREIALRSRADADASGVYPNPIVTEITDATTFYEAEDYHQDYYRANKQAGYCHFVIAPKLEKLGLEY